MEFTLNQKGWRVLWMRTAFLSALWLAVVLAFATEFYLSAPDGPMRISWTDAARASFRDWFPWILLFPPVVVLAGQFRVDRHAWRRCLVIHLAACLAFAFLYEGLLILVYPTPLAGGAFITTNAMARGMQSFSVSTQTPGSRPPATTQFMATTNGMTVFGIGGPPSYQESRNGVVIGYHDPRPVNRWTQFLHRAVLRTQFTIPIYWCIVCICWVMNHFQETREQERRALELEARLTQANLQTLKMQLQPHFLFNTLNAISSLIHDNPQAADDMVVSLSDFLRMTLTMSSANEVPLRKELEFVNRYLEMQQTRFGERLRVLRELDSQVIDAMVPPLILQPLVENAIRYGIEPRETGGTVTIRAWRKGEVLHMEVCDDGEGFKGAQLLGDSYGIGLSNTKTRLQELYGDKHHFKLIAHDPAGACVRIEIPFRVAPSQTRNVT